MIKSSSLFYSLMLMLLIGALLTVLLLNVSTSRKLVLSKEREMNVIGLASSATSYGLENYLSLDNREREVNPFNDDFRFTVSREIWGMFELLKSKSYVGKDTITRVTVVGKKNVGNKALYLRDNDKPLLVGDNAKLIGDLTIPNEGVKKLDLTGQKQKIFLVNGKESRSDKELPSLRYKDNLQEAITKSSLISYEDLAKNSPTYINFFGQASTILMRNQEELKNVNISGKCIIKSDSLIRVSNSARLEDVIIMSPSVIVEEGFKGSIQIFATNSVVVEKGVTLAYPSFVSLKKPNLHLKNAGIQIFNGSSIFGGILLMTDKKNTEKGLLLLEKETLVVGDIYSSGCIEIKGTVYGTVYTSALYSNTGEATYNNAITEGIIDANIPKEFVRLNFISNKESAPYQMIKVL